MTTNDEIEDLKEQTQKGTRVAAAANESDSTNRRDVLTDHYDTVRSGDASRTLSFRDEFLAGLLHGSQADDDLAEDLGAALQDTLDDDHRATDRSEMLRQLARIGLREGAPEIFDDAKEAYARSVAEDI